MTISGDAHDVPLCGIILGQRGGLPLPSLAYNDSEPDPLLRERHVYGDNLYAA